RKRRNPRGWDNPLYDRRFRDEARRHASGTSFGWRGVKRRLPAQAATFYPDTEGALRTQIQQSFLHPLGPRAIPTIPGTRNQNLLGLIVPHAGYRYSGPVAAHSYYHQASAGIFESIIILRPNHTRLGSGVSTMTEGVWTTTLGNV